MKICFEKSLADQYNSPSQKIRVLTESWVEKQVFCPSCGSDINRYGNNRPVADFYCSNCEEEYELKSKKNRMGQKIVDGAYKTMIERLQDSNNPNFFLLNYHPLNYEVLNFFVIPKHFFIPQIIEERKALSGNARRAGWIGCNIILDSIPETGKIFYIKNQQIANKADVIKKWQKTLFLREEKEVAAKGWILNVMQCIEQLGKKDFDLDEIYQFENSLKQKYPKNQHIKAKIRQQLQFLRDKGYLDFLEKGRYRLH